MAGIAGGGAPISGRATNEPWSGGWWPYSDDAQDPNLYDANGPLDKLDQLIESYNPGYDSQAREWEAANHQSNKDWEGHCQAWAAASLLGPEPAGSVTINGISFTQDDIEALRTATLVDVTAENFWGTRVNSPQEVQGTAAYDDLNPAWMHHLLADRVAGKGESFIMDTSAGTEVWNFPVTGFDARPTQRHEDGSVSYETTVNFASPQLGVDGNTEFSETYTYRLWTTADGRMDGEWTGTSAREHPDFAWTPDPTSPAETPVDARNPKVTVEWVDFIYRQAAEANRQQA